MEKGLYRMRLEQRGTYYGCHRLRHYGLIANAARKSNFAKIRTLLTVAQPEAAPLPTAEVNPFTLRGPCPCCGGPMRIVKIFRWGQTAVTGATTGAGGMMTCPSPALTCRRFLFGPRTAEACPARQNPLETDERRCFLRPDAPVSGGGSHPFAQPLHQRRSPTAASAATGSALFP
jgi:hypothetical protein